MEPNFCTQRRMVRPLTSMPRSASSPAMRQAVACRPQARQARTGATALVVTVADSSEHEQ
jgi:hypothetical protein